MQPYAAVLLFSDKDITVYTPAELIDILTLNEFPKSAQYDPNWVLSNLMGPNVLWLTEALAQKMRLERGWEHWLLWHEVCRAQGYPFYELEMNALKEDAGRNLGFTRVVATKV